MASIFSKIIYTPKTTIKPKDVYVADASIEAAINAKLKAKIGKMFNGSLAIRQIDAGSDNAVENELTALSSSYYDCARFGISFVASPRHADMLMVTGPVSRNMATALKDAYEATPDPKIVVAVGDDAIDGGIFAGSYAICGGVSSVVPVDYTIAGDPPTPLEILKSLLVILEDLEGKKKLDRSKKC